MKRADQAGQVSLQCVPHDLIVDSKVRMNETIAQQAHLHPALGVVDQPQLLGATEIVDRRAGEFAKAAQVDGQQFVHESILHAAELAGERFQPVDSFRRFE